MTPGERLLHCAKLRRLYSKRVGHRPPTRQLTEAERAADERAAKLPVLDLFKASGPATRNPTVMRDHPDECQRCTSKGPFRCVLNGLARPERLCETCAADMERAKATFRRASFSDLLS